jgi:hypothetical protein
VTTVRDAVVAAEPVAAEVLAPEATPDSDRAVHARDARARVADTERDGKGPGLLGLLVADVRGWWGWTAAPMTRCEVITNRIPSPDAVPDGSGPLRWGWAVWMHLAAIPITWLLLPPAGLRPTLLRQLLRGVVWVFQHPARFALATSIAGALAAMWIAT